MRSKTDFDEWAWKCRQDHASAMDSPRRLSEWAGLYGEDPRDEAALGPIQNKVIIRSVTYEEAKMIADQALTMNTGNEIRAMVKEKMQKIGMNII